MASKRKSAQRKRRAEAPAHPAPDASKRNTLKLLRNVAIGAVATGGAGLYGTRAVQATIAEADLSRIGKGTRSVVQIHDPQCQLCTTLQRQTRRALKAYSEDEVTYLVANIKTREGAAFAGRFGVPHVTLLFFDETGTQTGTLRGPATPARVEAAIAAHLR